jgi:hypothetical protein
MESNKNFEEGIELLTSKLFERKPFVEEASWKSSLEGESGVPWAIRNL